MTREPEDPTEEEQLDVSEQIKEDRLNDIANARALVRQVRGRVLEETAMGRLSANEATERLLEAVQQYLSELRPYRDMAPGYWEGDPEEPLGAIVARPPARDSELWETEEPRANRHGPSRSDLPDPDHTYDDLEPVILAEFRGLDDVTQLSGRIKHEWICKDKRRHAPNATKIAKAEYTIDQRTLDVAMLRAMDFAREIGLYLSPNPLDEDIL